MHQARQLLRGPARDRPSRLVAQQSSALAQPEAQQAELPEVLRLAQQEPQEHEVWPGYPWSVLGSVAASWSAFWWLAIAHEQRSMRTARKAEFLGETANDGNALGGLKKALARQPFASWMFDV